MLIDASKHISTVLVFILITSNSFADDSEIEIRNKMWNTQNEEFQKIETPQKWSDESAVIIAALNRFEYKKPAVISELHTNNIFHNRIKLNDQNAVNEYAEMSYSASNGRKLNVYVGFKVVKPDGSETIVDHTNAVEMEKTLNGETRSYMKLAIPNLEVGDILDYYICEYNILTLNTKIFYFNPIIYNLPQEYPVMNQRLEFSAQRRCFISLRSMNGAPELTREYDEENDEQHYTLVDQDRDAVKDIKWFYPNRALPTIKFRAAYASGKAIRQNDVLLGEPGVVKNEVSQQELTDFVSYLIANSYNDPKAILKHVRKNVDKNASDVDKVKAGYYFQRNVELKWEEVSTIADKDQWNQGIASVKDNNIGYLDRFSGFIASMNIPYEIVIAVPRDISSIEDLLLEPELQYLFRIKDGDEYFYFADIDTYSVPNEIPLDLQGADAYVVDGLANFKNWKLNKITLPVSNKEDNITHGQIQVELGEDFETVKLNIKREISGIFKPAHQYVLMDYYDYKDEEGERFELNEDFAGTLWMKKRLLGLRESYLSSREETKDELLEFLAKSEYDFNVSSISDLHIDQTGRYDDQSSMIYSFAMESSELISRVGPNYLLDVGKLIEKQIKIEDNEMERAYSIYMSCPRTYSLDIRISIPDEFEVKGLENLDYDITTEQGAFVSLAKIDGNEFVLKTQKTYNSHYAEKESWPDVVKFLNAANAFTEQKLLLKKKAGI